MRDEVCRTISDAIDLFYHIDKVCVLILLLLHFIM
jgi:hypothetical protein